MANLSLSLSDIKAAGVYTLEYDDTTEVTVETNSLRLLVGFNKKGPFNKPVFLSDDSDRASIFGSIDTKLEAKGSFFNRSAQTLLNNSSIFALNLLNVDETVNGPDQVNFAVMSTDAATANPTVAGNSKYNETEYNGDASYVKNVSHAPYASFFERSRFWNASSENLLANVANATGSGDTASFENTNLLNFANVGTSEMSILIFKPTNLSGYDVTASEWYGSADAIPYGFIRPDDYISDYFIQVVAVSGNWTNYKQLSTDTTMSSYFNSNGIKKGKINSFVSSDGVTLLGSWTGCIIPDFQSKSGDAENVIDLINASTTQTGLLASFNDEAAAVIGFNYGTEDYGWYLDSDGDDTKDSAEGNTSFIVDLVGHGCDASTTIDFLSYYHIPDGSLTSKISHAYYFDATGNKNQFIITDADEAGSLSKGDFVKNNAYDSVSNPSGNSDIIPGITRITNKLFVPVNSDGTYTYNSTVYTLSNTEVIDVSNFNQSYSQGFYLYTAIEDVYINTKHDSKTNTVTAKGTAYNAVIDDFIITPANGSANAISVSNNLITFKKDLAYVVADFDTDNVLDSSMGVIFYAASAEETPVITIDDKTYTVNNAAGVNVYLTEGTFSVAGGNVVINTDNNITVTESDRSYVEKHLALTDSAISSSLRFIPMKGLSITKRHMPGYDEDGNIDVEAGVKKIYSMLIDDAGINKGLCNPEMVDFRYVVDSMGYGLDSMLGGKVYLSQLAMQKTKCTAIINAPSKKQFARSTNPYFCDTFVSGVSVKPAFSTEYIASGGNDSLPATKSFSLPDLDNGASFSAVFFPWLKYTVDSKTILVPPAADAANVLLTKFTGSDPYKICANNNGIISNSNVTGIEMSLDTTDREYLEPFGINPIIVRNSNIMLYGNQTAYQKVKSDLNKLHVRENLNTIEINCDAILQNYVFLYNNAQTRSDISQKLNPVLSAAQTSGAIDSYTIQCDTKNNTEEMIKNDFAVVDITVVMNHGTEKIVQRFNLTRSSSSTSSSD